MRWIAIKTLIRRECDTIGRYWLATLAPPAISTFLYYMVSAIRSGISGAAEVHFGMAMLVLGVLAAALVLIALRLVAMRRSFDTRDFD